MGTSRGWDGSRGTPVSGGSLRLPVCPFCPRGGVKGTVPPPPRCPRVPPPCPRSPPSRGRRLPLPRCLQRGGEGGAGPARSIASSPLRPPRTPQFSRRPSRRRSPPGTPTHPQEPRIAPGLAAARSLGARRRRCQDPGAAALGPPPRCFFSPSPPHGAPGVAMRGRSNSGVRLDGYGRLVQQTILRHQVRTGFKGF